MNVNRTPIVLDVTVIVASKILKVNQLFSREAGGIVSCETAVFFEAKWSSGETREPAGYIPRDHAR